VCGGSGARTRVSFVWRGAFAGHLGSWKGLWGSHVLGPSSGVGWVFVVAAYFFSSPICSATLVTKLRKNLLHRCPSIHLLHPNYTHLAYTRHRILSKWVGSVAQLRLHHEATSNLVSTTNPDETRRTLVPTLSLRFCFVASLYLSTDSAPQPEVTIDDCFSAGYITHVSLECFAVRLVSETALCTESLVCNGCTPPLLSPGRVACGAVRHRRW
jgi:hypothetical protein